MGSYAVLLAEPEESARERLRGVLERVGTELDAKIDVVEARDGTTAMALCSEKTFSLVVCEALLQGVSGLALLRALSKEGAQSPPVILVTGMGRDTDRYWGLRNGATAYFAKPFDETALTDRIKRTLTEPAAASELPARL